MRLTTFNIRLASMLALLFWSAGLEANPVDPFPNVNSHDYYGNMTAALKVVMDENVLEDVVVAVYSGDQIRGKGSPADPSNPGVIYPTVYGNNTGEKIYFKVYVESSGLTFSIDDNLEYTFNGALGSPAQPYIIYIDNAHPVSITEFDGIDNIVAQSITGRKAQFRRSFTAGVASTICLPFNFNPADGTGTFYEFVGVNDARTEVTMQDANITTDNPLQADKPYLFMPSSTGEITFNGTVTNDAGSIIAGTATEGQWTFKGSYARIDWTTDPGNIYGFAATPAKGENAPVQAGVFFRTTGGSKSYILPFRAYLEYSGGNSAPSRSGSRDTGSNLPDYMTVRLLGIDGTVTAIGSLDTRSGLMHFDDSWYTIDGRKLDGRPTLSGTYINNGHTIMIK